MNSVSAASPSGASIVMSLMAASLRSSFQVRNRVCAAPLGPVPSPVPSAKRRNVYVVSRSSAAIAR